MSRVVWVGALALGAGILLVTSAGRAGQDAPPADLVGTWSGKMRVWGGYCARDSVDVTLSVRADGRVTGTVGGATLRNGMFHDNRGWIARKLNMKSEYRITCDLDGLLCESSDRAVHNLNVPFNRYGAGIRGAMYAATCWRFDHCMVGRFTLGKL